MPSPTHETLASLFRDCPALGPTLLRMATDTDIPESVIPRPAVAEFSDLSPAEYRADVVIRLDHPHADPSQAPAVVLVIEIQLERDGDKRFSWPMYEVSTHARLRCPAAVLVITLDRAVARWCAEPIPIGPSGSVSHPLVLGPQQIPRVSDKDTALRLPELAVLSAAAHADQPDSAESVALALDACNHLDNDRATVYADFIFTRLGEATRRALETLMERNTYNYQSEFARKYFEQGHAQGRR
ncbi:MAG: hypothetical protein AAGC55_31240, partial [Myxococcota bacterium]